MINEERINSIEMRLNVLEHVLKDVQVLLKLHHEILESLNRLGKANAIAIQDMTASTGDLTLSLYALLKGLEKIKENLQ